MKGEENISIDGWNRERERQRQEENAKNLKRAADEAERTRRSQEQMAYEQRKERERQEYINISNSRTPYAAPPPPQIPDYGGRTRAEAHSHLAFWMRAISITLGVLIILLGHENITFVFFGLVILLTGLLVAWVVSKTA